TGGMAWDQPCMLMPDGSFGFGIEYYHNTMLWVVPMALMGDNLQTFTHGNGLAARVVRAAGKGE
ncbi:MAG: hypothetical protein SFY92_05560, partial [Verrucomicrobiae bacterium]|nr:hypothetical protein [Verrucomicrobiae bacterium]